MFQSFLFGSGFERDIVWFAILSNDDGSKKEDAEDMGRGFSQVNVVGFRAL